MNAFLSGVFLIGFSGPINPTLAPLKYRSPDYSKTKFHKSAFSAKHL